MLDSTLKMLHRIGKKALSTFETVLNSYELAEKCILENIHGDFVECGVFAGTQSAAMALANQVYKQDRLIHMFDSFEGIPMAGPNDDESITSCIGKGDGLGRLVSTGVSSCSVADVKTHMKDWDLNPNQFRYYPGWFQDTLPPIYTPKIAILRLDGDLYESTKVCLEHLYPAVVNGGFVIIDDYALTGCRKACDEYWRKIGMTSPAIPIEGGGGPVYYKKGD